MEQTTARISLTAEELRMLRHLCGESISVELNIPCSTARLRKSLLAKRLISEEELECEHKIICPTDQGQALLEKFAAIFVD